MPKARTETFQVTIKGLLSKREEMMEETAITRERLAVLSNDIDALDRVLERLGYDGPVKLTPRVPRIVLFYKGELRQFLLGSIKEHGPSTARQLACRLLDLEKKDTRDRRMMNDVVRRMGRALRQMRDAKLVSGTLDKRLGETLYRLV